MTCLISNMDMAIRLRFRIAEIIALHLLFMFSIFGCSRYAEIHGTYLSQKLIDLSDVRIQFSLNDLSGKEIHRIVRLKRDGSFHFRIAVQGNYLLSAAIIDFSRKKWQSPQLSNDSSLLPLLVPSSGTLKLNNLYISEQIQILNPKNGQSISLDNDFEFKWAENSLAQYYSLSLYNWTNLGERSPVLTIFNIRGPQLKLNDISEIETVSGELDYETTVRKDLFLRQGQKIIPGQYGLSITAYLAAENDRQFITIARSTDEWKIEITDYKY